VGQFRRFVEQSGYVPESIADGTGGYGYNPQYDASKSKRGDAFEGRDVRYSWRNPGFEQTDAHPVVNVTWNDAQALAAWLSRQEGRSYRLPTEAQWEYAARAGTSTRYHCGDDPQCLLQVANTFDEAAKPYWPQFAANALPGNDGYAFTAPVARFAPNAFGLYDMHGNAWEWTQDLYGEDYYAHSPLDDPQGPEDGEVYVRRGGSWHTWSLYARSSYRNWNTPQTRYTLVGIRLIMDAP
jgi:formylglycine-generating enzyme required for sulfatase activity